MSSHYVSNFCDHYYYNSTCDCCMFQSNAHHYDGNAGFHLCELNNIGSTTCGPAATVDSEGHNEGFFWSHPIVQQQKPQSQMPSQAYANYAIDPSRVFFFLSWAFNWFLVSYIGACNVFSFCFQVAMWLPCSPMGAVPLGLATMEPFGIYPWQA